ncbi:MAG: T9SS type A sorting domain-containing protein [Bacteroidetes bacterium]|nr:MAG: T9SS type A sorting domain-containing protein [Bacteroidota bacterium]
MTRFVTYSSVFLFFLVSACNSISDQEYADPLQQKSEPYDQFSLQRSFPDPYFDWRGWRQTIASLRTAFMKSQKQADLPEGTGMPDWTLQGPGNVAGRVNAMAIHPNDDNIVLAGFSTGGIFKTQDGGMTWSPVMDNNMDLAIGDITYDSGNPAIVYAGTGDPNVPGIVFNGNGVYKSTDGGETWDYLGLSQSGIISKIVVDPDNSSIVYAAAMGNPYIRDSHRGIYKSTNGGNNWEKVLFVSDQAGASDLVINPMNPQILYASFWDRIRNNKESTIYGPNAKVYKSTDGGQNWIQLQGGLPTGIMGRTGLAISQQNPDKLYAVYIDSLSTPGGLYKTEDGGATWTSMNILALEDACGNFGWYFGKVRVDPTNDDDVYFLAIVLWRKEPGSTQWQVAANSHADCHELVFADSGKRYLGCDGGVYRNIPGQMQWNKSNNLPTTQFYHTSYNPHEPDIYYAGAQDNGIRKGNGNIYNGWSSVFPADGFRCAFHPNDPQTFWVETQNGTIHKTTDGGNSWQFGQACLGTPDRCNWDMPYFISRYYTDRLYAGTYRVYFSSNGSGWGPVSDDLTDGNIYGERFHTISSLSESPVLAEKLLAGTSDGNVWRREPNGTWFNISSGLPDRYVTAVIGSPTLSSRIFTAHSGFRDNENIPHVHRTDDNGNTWVDISGDLPNLPVNDLYVLEDHADSVLFAATDAGVYYTINSGSNWFRLGTSLPFVPVFDLELNPVRRELLAATYARGLWTFPVDSVFALAPDATVAVNGMIRTEDGNGISKVRVCSDPVQLTGISGAYEILSNAACLNNDLTPIRNDNPINGVSTFDLVLINRHILGIEALGSPYKRIAADANNSRSITTFDIVTLRKLILGIDTSFLNSNSWRFIPEDYVFPDPENPFLQVFPESVNIGQAGFPVSANFIGLKMGDVNGNAILDLQEPASDRGKAPWIMAVENQVFKANEIVEAVFSAPSVEWVAAQFSVQYDPVQLELIRIEPLAPGISADNFGLQPQAQPCFTASFERMEPKTPAPVQQNTPLFRVYFQTKNAGTLRSGLHLGSGPTPAAAFRNNGTVLRPELEWRQPVATLPAGVQLFPNPFGGAGFWLNTNLEQEGNGRLLIYDNTGRRILQQTIRTDKVEHVTATAFRGKGVYWYQVQISGQQFSGKIIYQ